MDVASSEIALSRSGYDLIIEYGVGDRITVDNHYLSDSYKVDRFEFTDATLTLAELMACDTVRLTASNDTI
ncbi:MAG: hypothetical protein LBJ59_07230 [Zoogloeaceae bacterium]|nr:hypothetical protein [Zoogloeaceae bacterium]